MGARLNWLAVQGADKASLLARLGLVEAGPASDEFDSPLACAVFPHGWLVLVSSEAAFDLDKATPHTAAEGLTLACEIEEHVMFSRLRAFQDGAPAWAVTHDPEDGGTAVAGEPPPPFAELRAALVSRQAAEDEAVDHLFDLPVRLGQALCGYAHDEPHSVAWTRLEVQARTPGGRNAASHPARRSGPPPATRVPKAFAAELEPCLLAAGWVREATETGRQEGAWWFKRLRNGRLEAMQLCWSDYGPGVDLEADFVVYPSPDSDAEPLLRGATRVVRDAGDDDGLHLRRRIAALLRGRTAPAPPARLDLVEKLIARVRDDLAAIETLLTTGEASPRLRIRHGSADLLRPAGA